MDYTEGAINVPRKILIGKAFEKLGMPSPGAAGALFTKAHFYDTVDDARYYCLTRENAIRLVNNVVKARRWIKEKRDCDTRSFLAAGDIAEFVDDAGWEFGAALWRIKYDSASLTKNKEKRFSGYHATLLLWTFDYNKGDYEPLLFQPPGLTRSGETTPALFQEPKDEILFWVYVEGMA